MKLSNPFKRERSVDSNKSFMQKAWDIQSKIESRQRRIGKGKYGRVLKMARKPTDEEFSKTSKITAVGILLVGALGFVIWFLASQAAPWIAEQLGLG